MTTKSENNAHSVADAALHLIDWDAFLYPKDPDNPVIPIPERRALELLYEALLEYYGIDNPLLPIPSYDGYVGHISGPRIRSVAYFFWDHYVKSDQHLIVNVPIKQAICGWRSQDAEHNWEQFGVVRVCEQCTRIYYGSRGSFVNREMDRRRRWEIEADQCNRPL